jgi:BarA-like signal transduction histidine kinase
MNRPHANSAGECDIVALNYLTSSELELRYRSLTSEPPPRMSRALLITAVAYETMRKLHCNRLTVALRETQTRKPGSADVAR